jgi:hypothetical protein
MSPHEIIFMEQSIMFSVRDNEITLGVSNRNKREEEGKKEEASRDE